MEIGNLSRAIGSKWSVLWPKLRKLREHREIGRALAANEEDRLRAALVACESDAARTATYIALNTGMRSDEIRRLRWSQIDLGGRLIAVGESKSEAGRGRRIPINAGLAAVLDAHRDWCATRFGGAAGEWFLFPAGQRGRVDGRGRREDHTRPIGSIRKAWESLRRRAGVRCRFHDLRHTVATKMAEAGIAESTMLAIMGHMSRAMLERYSHIRVQAKRDAVEALCSSRDRIAVSTLSTTSAAEGPVQ